MLKENEMEKIKKSMEKEFKDDPALQQVHIARQIIKKEAELSGLSYIEYIKQEMSKIKQVH